MFYKKVTDEESPSMENSWTKWIIKIKIASFFSGSGEHLKGLSE